VIGEKVRSLRRERDMSLRELAAATGLSAGMLSQIERSATDPSLATIRKLAAVFGSDLATLFAEPAPSSVHHSKVGKRPGLAVASGHITYERLTPGRTDLEVLRGLLAAGEATSEECWSHPSTECTYVIAGTLTAEVGGIFYELLAGESLTFDSRSSHRYINRGDGPAEFIVSVTPPNP
jgi:transcriptional regulator with XRE-family HTH domain